MDRRFGSHIPPGERRPVAWYAPGVLWQAGRELVQSLNFQRNLDRREMFTPVLAPIDLAAQPATTPQPFWFDFLSDTGDGGNAGFTVAQALLARELVLPQAQGEPLVLPEGELLLLGGDLAYPSASAAEYQYRFIEMLGMAQDPASRFGPPGSDGPRKTLAAIPQNHDWFDSASTFCRYFVNFDKGAVIGARTPQRQTWFAARLPHGWWVLGLDFALAGDLDRQQFESFCALLDPLREDGLRPGDDVLLVLPEPYWTRPLGDGAAPGYPHRYQRLEAQLEAAGVRIRMRLAGDLHHYRRETLALDPATGRDTHLVTCGTGGAFLHPTHSLDVQAVKWLDRSPEPQPASADLAGRVRVGRAAQSARTRAGPPAPDPGAPPLLAFAPAAAFPPPSLTRRLAWTNLWAFFTVKFSQPHGGLAAGALLAELWASNFGFAVCLGLVYGFNAYVNSGVFSASFAPDGFGPMAGLGYLQGQWLWLKAMVFSPFAALVNAGMLAGCVRIAWEGPARPVIRLATGLLHGMAHGYLIFALYWLASQALAQLAPPLFGTAGPLAATLGALATWVAVGLMGIGVGGLLFGLYLAVACGGFAQLPNNAFGSLAIEHYKGFLRFRLVPEGVEVFMLGIDQVPRRLARDEAIPPGWRVVDRFFLRK